MTDTEVVEAAAETYEFLYYGVRHVVIEKGEFMEGAVFVDATVNGGEYGEWDLKTTDPSDMMLGYIEGYRNGVMDAR